jgi:hypothetical protein
MTTRRDHDHQDVPPDPALRLKALESLMVAKGLLDRATLDALTITKPTPGAGARLQECPDQLAVCLP